MLVRPLMKLARSLKTNSPAQLFSGFFLQFRMPSDPVGFVLPSLLFFFSNGLNSCCQNRPTTARNGKGRCLHIVGGVYQSRLQITIIAYYCKGDGLPSNAVRFNSIERVRFVRGVVDASVSAERPMVRPSSWQRESCQSGRGELELRLQPMVERPS